MNNSLGHSQIMAGPRCHLEELGLWGWVSAHVAPGCRGPPCSGPRPFTEKPQGVRCDLPKSRAPVRSSRLAQEGKTSPSQRLLSHHRSCLPITEAKSIRALARGTGYSACEVSKHMGWESGAGEGLSLPPQMKCCDPNETTCPDQLAETNLRRPREKR